MSEKIFAVLGSGMQGTAVAYDMALFGQPKAIFLGDYSLEEAKKSADKVNTLSGKQLCKPFQVDALDPVSLTQFLDPVDVLASCVPYWMHPKVAQAAIVTQTHMVDMGGNTEVTHETLSLNDKAKSSGVTIIPDTGLAPGLVNNLAMYFMEKFDHTHSVKLYCGGLPQHPKPIFNYRLAFNIEGLTTEYNGKAVTLKAGKIHLVDTLEDLETLEHDVLGTLEAFNTSGGTSTAPYTWEGQMDTFEYKTFRYPGHCKLMKIFKDYGFWDNEYVEADGVKIRPRELFHKLMSKAFHDEDRNDLVVIRGIGQGTLNGKQVTLQLDILDKKDDKTGFTAMERTTGFSTSIHAINISKGKVDTGCICYENAMNGTSFLKELVKRGIEVKGF